MRMRPPRELVAGAGLLLALVSGACAEPAREPAKGDMPFDAGTFGNRKEPITVTADALEYDYKANVVVYRGDVVATQGDVKVRSDKLTVTLAAERSTSAADPSKSSPRLQQIVAVGSVRIDNGTRWATGGRAVFEQGTRTLVLTETPVLHDGSNEVAGDRVVVYLDENRSVVEGGRKRVKAVLYPSKDGDLESKRAGAEAGAGKP
jgi:lipopolysaccharide export system protein LptA